MHIILSLALLFAAIFWIDNKIIYRILYVALVLALLTLIYNTFIIYTADFEVSPWHESGKVAYLVVVIEVLWLLAINVLIALLARKVHISKNLLVLPFISAIILGIYLIFYVNPPLWFCVSGAAASTILFLSTIVIFFANFDKSLRSK